MALTPIQTDIAIVGGGIAGLWLMNLLREEGFSVALIEKEGIGSGQTLASQGMIHGGIKYALGGLLTDASETIAAMPDRWNDCLAGRGTLDLREVKTLSQDYYLFSDASLTSKVTAFFGSKAIEGRVETVSPENAPPAFQHPQFSGLVYRLKDLVLDTNSLLNCLATPRDNSNNIYTGTSSLVVQNDRLSAIKLEDGHIVEADRFILAAGAGNGPLIKELNLPVSMQLRPLNQVVVEGDSLPALYAHAVSLKAADKPRLTVTTHTNPSGRRVWYLGGQLAESGVKRSDTAQIAFARKELSALFPWINFDQCTISTFRVDRAEAGQSDQGRPDTPYVGRFGNTMVCWPTKLTLAPLLGDMVLENIDLTPTGRCDPHFDCPLQMGSAPWGHHAT